MTTRTVATPRDSNSTRLVERGVLLLIIIAGAARRLQHVDFGLPALNDPDEPLFVMTTLDMLRSHSLDPGWFGHPATTLFYCLALVFAGVGLLGVATGRWTDTNGFVAALYADPGIVFLPGRLFIVACGIACVYLTFLVGKRAVGPRVGLAAAALLACNPLHVEYSQIIRTDVPATCLMLLSCLCSISVARGGGRRGFVLAGATAGLAAATKWPAAVVLVNVLGATMLGYARDRGIVRWLPLAPVAAVFSLVAISPFLILNYPTVLRDLLGEARPVHLGATGGGFLPNLVWYFAHPLRDCLGIAGVVLTVLGAVYASFRARLLAGAVLPAAGLLLITICAQTLVWERWLVPLLPFAALTTAVAIDALAQGLPRGTGKILFPLTMGALLLPMIMSTQVRTRERANDTRQVASAWIRANVPATRSILVEDAAFDLLQRPGRLLFPMGGAGCVDVRRALSSTPRYSKVASLRASKPIVDLGNLDPRLLPTCAADFAVLTHYERYQAEARTFGKQAAIYRCLVKGGRLRAVFRSIKGERRGPVTQIFELPRRDNNKIRNDDCLSRIAANR